MSAMLGLHNTDQKIHYLLESLLSGAWPKFILVLLLFCVIAIMLSIGAGLLVSILSDNRPSSLLLLTKESRHQRDAFRQKRKYALPKVIAGICIAIVTGLVSNLVFFWIIA